LGATRILLLTSLNLDFTLSGVSSREFFSLWQEHLQMGYFLGGVGEIFGLVSVLESMVDLKSKQTAFEPHTLSM